MNIEARIVLTLGKWLFVDVPADGAATVRCTGPSQSMPVIRSERLRAPRFLDFRTPLAKANVPPRTRRRVIRAADCMLRSSPRPGIIAPRVSRDAEVTRPDRMY